MDTATIAVIVASITGGSAFIQGVVQGALTGRGAVIAARQQAIQNNIDVLQELLQAVVRLHGAAFYIAHIDDERSNTEGIGQSYDRLGDAQDDVLLRLHGIPAEETGVRRAVIAGWDAVNAMRGLDRDAVQAVWDRDRDIIFAAHEEVSMLLRKQYSRLEEATHGVLRRGWDHVKRGVGFVFWRGPRRLFKKPALANQVPGKASVPLSRTPDTAAGVAETPPS